MKRYAVLLIALLISGCASQSAAAKKDADAQLADALSQNVKLQEQVRVLEKEKDDLKKERDDLKKERDDLKKGSLENVGEVRIGFDKALEIAKTAAPYMVVKQHRQVEFNLHNPDRWVAVWVLDFGNDQRPYQGTLIIDAITGKVLNATDAPGGG